MSVNDESQLPESSAQILTVERQPPQTILTFSAIHDMSRERCEGGYDFRRFETHDGTHRDADLRNDWGRHGFGVVLGVRVKSKSRDQLVRSSDIPSRGSERLRESSHQNVDALRVDSKVVADTASSGPECSNRMRLVDVEVELVSLLELEDSGQIDHSSFHGVKALNDQKNLLPWAMSPRLTLTDALSEQIFEIFHIVMLVHPDHGARESSSESDRRMVQLVRDDEATFAHQRREGSRVGCESHRNDHRIFCSNEFGDEPFGLNVKVRSTDIVASSRSRNAQFAYDLLGLVGTGSTRLCESEVVVGRYIEGLGRLSREGEIGEKVGRGSV